MEQIQKSPILNSEIKPFLSCKDYTVSQERFTLFIDKASELVITTPRPEVKDLGNYYESDAYISHTDSKKSFLDKVYQFVKNYALKKKLKLINSFDAEERTILDIGVGTGDFLSQCEMNKWNVVGVEPNQKARMIAESKLQGEKNKIYNNIEELLKAIQTDTGTLGLKRRSFDVITMWHVLEHVSNLNEYVSYLKQLLKPNGTLVIAVPNYKSYDANHYEEYWAAYDVPRHLWHFSKRAIAKLFQQKEMIVVKTIPMKFDAYYVSILSEKYKTGRSNYFKALYMGFKSNWKANRSQEYSSQIYVIKNEQ